MALRDFCVTKTKSSSRRGGARRTRNLVCDELTQCNLKIRPTLPAQDGTWSAERPELGKRRSHDRCRHSADKRAPIHH
jgi:hypothetical protein